MTSNKNPYQQKCLIGAGITLSLQNNYFKTWFMMRACSITQTSKILNRAGKYLNHEQKKLKILHLGPSISFISNDIHSNEYINSIIH